MFDMLIILLFFLLPIATGSLWLLIGAAEGPGHDVDPDFLTMLGLFSPVVLPFLLFVVVPMVVWRISTRHGESRESAHAEVSGRPAT